MADVLVRNPITLEDLAERILRNLQKHQGEKFRIQRGDFQDRLCEEPEAGEGGVWCDEKELDEAVDMLIARGVVEEVKQSARGLPSRQVLRLKS